MIGIGDLVKIEDIGTPARCIAVRENELQLDLCGDVFWIINRLCHTLNGKTDGMEATA